MSQEVIEQIHYGYAQNRERWRAWDIIKSGKEVSVLFASPGKRTQVTFFGGEAKELIDLLDKLENPDREEVV